MARWIFEPGHTGVDFHVRHMMVTWVRGHVKGITGWVDYDPEEPERLSVEARIDPDKIWTGEAARDAHLKSPDFFNVAQYPEITFRGSGVRLQGEHEFHLAGELTIHGTTKPVTLKGRYLGHWQTSFWEGGADRGPVERLGFNAETTIDRFDFGVDWQDTIARNGVVAGREVHIVIDVEAIRESDLQRIEREMAA